MPHRLPIGVIAEILGVPASDHYLFSAWADDLLSFQGVNNPRESDLFRAQKAIMEMRPYITAMLEERRRKPVEDLMSKFVAAEAVGERITESELVSTTVTLFVAGFETTVSLISNTLLSLLQHPTQLELLQQDPALITSTIEESLRYESPVSRQPRIMKKMPNSTVRHLSKIKWSSRCLMPPIVTQHSSRVRTLLTSSARRIVILLLARAFISA